MRTVPLQQPLKPKNTGRTAGHKQEYRLFALLGWLVALITGLLVLIGVVPGTRGAGALCALMGAGGCAWEWNYWAHQWRNRQKIRESARNKAAKKINRQARQAEQREDQRQRKVIQARTREAQEQRTQAERADDIECATQQAAQRSARFAQVTLETQRLQSLDAVAFRAEAERIFAERGLHPQTEIALNIPGLCLLRLPDESLDIAQFVVDNTPVAVADVEQLEQARQQANASRAYLIGRGHFTAPALRLSQRYPITFVEPQLLAHWKISAETE